MPAFALRLDCLDGADLDTAAGEAAHLAAVLGVILVFTFNGHSLVVVPGATKQDILLEYWQRVSLGVVSRGMEDH